MCRVARLNAKFDKLCFHTFHVFTKNFLSGFVNKHGLFLYVYCGHMYVTRGHIGDHENFNALAR